MKIQRSQLNASIRDIPLPDNMRELPVDRRGFPVPFFVARPKPGEDWDFRVVFPEESVRALKEHLCWVCGNRMGQKNAYVTGPMCTVTGTTAEPPAHLSCAEYAALACPFLANPSMRRNEKDLPEDKWMPGTAIMHNPGVTGLLVTRDRPRPFDDGRGNILINMGRVENLTWYASRRRATRKEVMDAIERGLVRLMEAMPEEAKSDWFANEHLQRQLSEVMRWLPPPAPGEDPPGRNPWAGVATVVE
jgi:hypothetical protein